MYPQPNEFQSESISRNLLVDSIPAAMQPSISKAAITEFPRKENFILSQAIPEYLQPLVLNILDMKNLPSNWDSYNSPKISSLFLNAAIAFSLKMFREDTPLPSVVPTSKGGVQLEWHINGVDFEIDFVNPNLLFVSFEDHHISSDDPDDEKPWEKEILWDSEILVFTPNLLSTSFEDQVTKMQWEQVTLEDLCRVGKALIRVSEKQSLQ